MGESGSHFSLFDFTACFEWEGKVPDAVFFSVGDGIYFYFWKVFVTAFTASTLEQIIHGLMESFVLQNILLAGYYGAFNNIETLPHQVFLAMIDFVTIQFKLSVPRRIYGITENRSIIIAVLQIYDHVFHKLNK